MIIWKQNNFFDEKLAVLSTLKNIGTTILQLNNTNLTHVLLLNTSLTKNTNTFILEATMDYLVLTERFGEPLFNNS